ncbi:MAG TPA: aminotransferase class IV [Sedimentisphaerales bacterium]|nr:aminotransferase class IV [Sedimentisphaerales bacterium]
MQIAMIHDRIVPMDQLEPAYLDRGTFFGDGVYEVVRSYNGKIFALDEHLERFARSLAAVEITALDIAEVRSRVENAFAAAGIPNAKIYFHATRGSAPRDHAYGPDLKPNFFLTVTTLSDASHEKAAGIAVSTYPDVRWKRCDIKSLNLLPNVLARADAARKGCAEAIFVDDAGLITEGAASAFFAITAQTLRTAPLKANILPSITRKFVLRAARDIGLPVKEESFTPQFAASADEAFIAVTTKDIVPVVKFDDKTIGPGSPAVRLAGKPGKFTKLLIEQFRSFT